MSFGILLQQQNREVAKKLGIATLLMFTLPIASYFVAQEYVFYNKDEPSMWAGCVAVLVTNVVIGGYVYSAFSEEEDESDETTRSKTPRVGVFKERVD